GDREPPARPQYARSLAEHQFLVRREVDDAVGDDAVDTVGGLGWQCVDAALPELDVSHHGIGRESARLGELGGGEVNAEDPPRRSDLDGGDEGVHPGAAAQIHDELAGTQVGQVEEVADPCKGFDGTGRDPVEQVGRITEVLGKLAAHFEVVRTVGLLRYQAVHLLDLDFEFRCVDVSHAHAPSL